MNSIVFKNRKIGVGVIAAVALTVCSSARAQTCFGLLSSDPSVCSGQGTCIAPDTCVCNVGYSGSQCESAQSAIPAVSDWGVVAMALLLLTVGAVVLNRRQQAT